MRVHLPKFFKAVLFSLLVVCVTTVRAEKVFRVTAIPDESPTELVRKAEPLMKYLSDELNMKVKFTPVSDHSAAVEALVNKQVDMAWLGGFTFVQAKTLSNDNVLPIVQRVEDEKFTSVFITTNKDIHSLSDLKNKTVIFGSNSSTSGHLMPRSFLLDKGLNPEQDFKRIAYSGAPDATISFVANGRFDAGVVNSKVWEKFVKEGKVDSQKVRVFYTTPHYYDFNWTVHKSVPHEVQNKLIKAFIALNQDSQPGSDILSLQRASGFVTTRAENYSNIERAAKSAGLLK